MSSDSVSTSPSVVSSMNSLLSADSEFSNSTASATYDDSITRQNPKDQPETWSKWNFAEKFSVAFCEGVEHRFSCVDENEPMMSHGIIGQSLDSIESDGEEETSDKVDFQEPKKGTVSGFLAAQQMAIQREIANHNSKDHNSAPLGSENFIGEYHNSKTSAAANSTDEAEANALGTDSRTQANHRGWGGVVASPKAAWAQQDNPIDQMFLTHGENGTFDTSDSKPSLSTIESDPPPKAFGGVVQRAIRGLSLTNNKPKSKNTPKGHESDSEYTTEDDSNQDTDTDCQELERHTIYDAAPDTYYEDDSTYATDKTGSTSSGENLGHAIFQQPCRDRHPADSRNDSVAPVGSHSVSTNGSKGYRVRDHASVGSGYHSIDNSNYDRAIHYPRSSHPSSNMSNMNTHTHTNTNNRTISEPIPHLNPYTVPPLMVVPSAQYQKQHKQKYMPALHTFPARTVPSRNRSYGSQQSVSSTSLSSFGNSSKHSSSTASTGSRSINDRHHYHGLPNAYDRVPRSITKKHASYAHYRTEPEPLAHRMSASMRIAQQLGDASTSKLAARKGVTRVGSDTPKQLARNRSEESNMGKEVVLGQKQIDGHPLASSSTVVTKQPTIRVASKTPNNLARNRSEESNMGKEIVLGQNRIDAPPLPSSTVVTKKVPTRIASATPNEIDRNRSENSMSKKIALGRKRTEMTSLSGSASISSMSAASTRTPSSNTVVSATTPVRRSSPTNKTFNFVVHQNLFRKSQANRKERTVKTHHLPPPE